MRELKVQPIRNGTVIDHIDPGMAFKVLRVLGLPRRGGTSVVSAIMNVPSGADARKDIVKVEDRELRPEELSRIALIAPHATINIIRDYNVAEKREVEVPDEVADIVRCTNPNCVTNHEPVAARFAVVHKEPVVLRCAFCDRVITDVAEHVV